MSDINKICIDGECMSNFVGVGNQHIDVTNLISNGNITVPYDGWLIVYATQEANVSAGGVLDIANVEGQVAVRGTSFDYRTSGAITASLPVKKGFTYKINAYRCTLSSARLFY